MEVLDKVDFERGFLCHKCGFPLKRNADTDRGGHEQSTRLNAQFKFITDLLPKIDQVVIPDNTFEKALESARPVIRDQLNPTTETAPVDSRINKPTAVTGLTNTGPTSIAVTLTASDGPTEADKAAEQARKDALKAQNQLPAHFTHSTVTGEQILPTSIPTFRSSQSFEDKKDTKDAINITPSFVDGAEIDIYFAQLKAEQAREAVKQEEEEDEEDDEEDEEFEDVVPATGSGIGTPASSASVNGQETKSLASGLAGVLKKSNTGTGSSNGGTSTGAASPATGPQTPDSSGRASKRVRIEEPEQIVKEEEEEESEEDIEFEDVSK
jgi:transcription initiation factor TFIIE subunit alpha